MMPAHQRLEAGDLAVDMGLRLVVQLDLAAHDGRAQILLQRALFAQLLVHRRLEEADRSARFRFGAEQRGVGVGDQRHRVGAVLREYGDADGQSHALRSAIDIDIGIERRQQPGRQRLGGRRLRPGRRDHLEFVAADAGDEGALAGLLQPAGDFAQQAVAHRVTEHVVDRLEAVEVDAEQGKAFARRSSRFRAWRRCIR